MEELSALEGWVAPLLRRLEPAERRRLARVIARDLQRTQSQRIGQQRAPDGTPYPRRKPQKRGKDGRIKRRRMFAKLRQARYLRTRAAPDEAAVFITGRAAAIARVHQEGLVDAVRRGGPRVRYERRVLLGFSPDDRERVTELVLAHLAGRM